MRANVIMYDSTVPAGAKGMDAQGRPAEYVTAEDYYRAYLGQVMNATLVFLHAGVSGRVPTENLLQVDDAIAAAYWDDYEACLMPRMVLAALARAGAGPAGQLLLDSIEQVRRDILAAESLEAAEQLHVAARLKFLDRLPANATRGRGGYPSRRVAEAAGRVEGCRTREA
jgi:hypothetical protein